MPILLNSVHFIGKNSYQLVKLAFIISALAISHLIGNYAFVHIFNFTPSCCFTLSTTYHILVSPLLFRLVRVGGTDQY